MATQPRRFITREEYLEIERKAEFRSEYYNGEMFPMEEVYSMAGAREPRNFGHDECWSVNSRSNYDQLPAGFIPKICECIFRSLASMSIPTS